MRAAATTGVDGRQLRGGFDLSDIRVAASKANDRNHFGQKKEGQTTFILADLITDRNGNLSAATQEKLGGLGSNGITLIASRLAREGTDLATECRLIRFKDKRRPELYCRRWKYAFAGGRIHIAKISGGRKK